MAELKELRRLAEEAAAENDVESDWFCPELIESDAPILSSRKARRFIAAMTPQMAMRLILLADRAAAGVPVDAPWKPVGYVPYCHTDGHDCIVGEFRMDEFDEKPFEIAHPEHWECRPVFLGPCGVAACAPTEPKGGA